MIGLGFNVTIGEGADFEPAPRHIFALGWLRRAWEERSAKRPALRGAVRIDGVEPWMREAIADLVDARLADTHAGWVWIRAEEAAEFVDGLRAADALERER